MVTFNCRPKGSSRTSHCDIWGQNPKQREIYKGPEVTTINHFGRKTGPSVSGSDKEVDTCMHRNLVILNLVQPCFSLMF
jgi:hypothetical protein